MIDIQLRGDDLVIAELDILPRRLQDELVKAVTGLAINVRDKVQTEHLSGPTGVHSLSVITGALRRDVIESVEVEEGQAVIGRIFYAGDVPYAAIHEFGGIIHIPEIEPKSAQALHFVIDGKDIFTRRTRAHDVSMPERAPLRTGFSESEEAIIEGLYAAVYRATNP